MGAIRTAFETAYRDFNTEGVAASERRWPPKAELRALGAVIEEVMGTFALGIATVDTLPGGAPGEGEPTVIIVKDDPNPANNGIRVWRDGAWEDFVEIYTGVAGIVQPLVDEANDAAAAADADATAAAASAANAATAVQTAFGAGTGPTGGTVTFSVPLVNQTQTWNGAGEAFKAWRVSITDTASLASSRFVEFVRGGADQFGIDKLGTIQQYSATNAAKRSMIDVLGSHGTATFLHDFTYGNNGTVTPDGRNLFLGQAAGNRTLGATATVITQASYNLGIGRDVLAALTTGYRNVMIGNIAGQVMTTGFENVAVGASAMRLATTARNSVAIGFAALGVVTTGTSNTAVGSGAGSAITTGSDNLAFGLSAAGGTSTGASNIAIGSSSLRLNAVGNENVAIGNNALYASTSSRNVAVGTEALRFQTSGDGNVAVGYQSLYSTTTGPNSVAIGFQAARANTTGRRLVAIGHSALIANTTGEDNIALGFQSAYALTTGIGNVMIGTAAGKAATTPNNLTMVGVFAGEGCTTGAFNSAFGAYAMQFVTNGFSNTAIGFEALKVVGTGYENVAVGDQAGIFNRGGNRNASVGTKAMDGNCTGNENTSIGFASGYVTREGDHNVYVGAWAGYGPAQPLTGVSGSWSGGVATLTFTANYAALPEGTPIFIQAGTVSPRPETYDSPTNWQGIHYVKAGATETSLSFDLAGDPGAWAGDYVIPGTANQRNTLVGAYAMHGVRTGGNNNTVFGYKSGYLLATGSNNVLAGYQAGDALTTGSRNIAVGADVDVDSPTGSDQINVGNRYYHDRIQLGERAADPGNPPEGNFVLWMSDGTGAGDDGDIMVKITAGGVTKTVTLVDFSAA